MAEKHLTLRMIAPEGGETVLVCESLRLPMADDSAGRGGGSLGIRPGHARALIALAEGVAEVVTEEGVRRFHVAGGFADVKNDAVTLSLLAPPEEIQ